MAWLISTSLAGLMGQLLRRDPRSYAVPAAGSGILTEVAMDIQPLRLDGRCLLMLISDAPVAMDQLELIDLGAKIHAPVNQEPPACHFLKFMQHLSDENAVACYAACLPAFNICLGPVHRRVP